MRRYFTSYRTSLSHVRREKGQRVKLTTTSPTPAPMAEPVVPNYFTSTRYVDKHKVNAVRNSAGVGRAGSYFNLARVLIDSQTHLQRMRSIRESLIATAGLLAQARQDIAALQVGNVGGSISVLQHMHASFDQQTPCVSTHAVACT